MGTRCPNGCGDYQSLGRHWAQSASCDHPDVPEKWLEIIEGLLLSDGYINRQRDKWAARFDITMASKKFLEHVDEGLGWLSSGVSKKPVEGNPNRDHFYRITTVSHPDIADVHEKWYPDDKEYPSDLALTPRLALYWYAGDGCLGFTSEGDTPYVRIRADKEAHRPQFIKNLFEEKGFKVYFSDNEVRVSTKDTPDFLDWIGGSVPGYEYKWELNHETYKNMPHP